MWVSKWLIVWVTKSGPYTSKTPFLGKNHFWLLSNRSARGRVHFLEITRKSRYKYLWVELWNMFPFMKSGNPFNLNLDAVDEEFYQHLNSTWCIGCSTIMNPSVHFVLVYPSSLELPTRIGNKLGQKHANREP